tara:strand:+ start:573 stop:857 length:285 start_codon:yes stop_codon:yes gene_type:complete
MTNKQILKKYKKILSDIYTIGDNGGDYNDTHYCNRQGASEDYYKLEDILAEGNTINNVEVEYIMSNLDKALIVVKAISKISELEDIIDKNIQYG